MSPGSYLRRLWRNLVRRREVERELDEELNAYRELSGQAVNLQQLKEEVRDVRVGSFLQTVLQDVRYGWRALRKSATFTTMAILALSLGIGATTAMFSVVQGVLLSPLPYSGADELAMVYMHFSPQNAERGNMSMADFLDWKRANRAFEDPQAMRNTRFDITGNADPVQVLGSAVTAGFFSTFKVRPLLGRTFLQGEDAPGADRVAVISETLWRRAFGGDPGMIGRDLNLNGTPTTVVGIVSAGFHFPRRSEELWTNLALVPPTRRGPFFYRGLGRLKPGVTWAQAQADANAAGRKIEQENSSVYHRLSLPALPLRDVMVGNVRASLWALLGAVLVLLAISGVNVACLLLARSAAREREIALRASLGASSGRLVRQLLTESMLLASIGGACGCVLAYGGIQALRAWNPGNLPRIETIGLNSGVLLFALAACVVTGLLFGLAPALHSRRDGLAGSLREGGRGGTAGAGRTRLQGILMVTEMALALVLITSAGLLVRSFLLLEQVSPGIDAPPGSVLTLNLSPSAVKYERDRDRAVVGLYDRVIERIEHLPGVASAAVADSLPPNQLSDYDTFVIRGQQFAPGESNPATPVNRVTSHYFSALGIPLRRGRWFNERDTIDSPLVTIISESMARRFFPGEDPIGKQIKLGGPELAQVPYMEIVGVVGDVLYWGLDNESRMSFYQPFSQGSGRREFIVVRSTTASAAALAAAVRGEIRQLDSDAVISSVETLQHAIVESVAQPRFRTALLGAFALCALVLAAIGLYGVIAYSVSQRTQEIGIRMALGAQRWDVLGGVVRQGFLLAVSGAVLGVAGALLTTRLLTKLLFHVQATDAMTFVAGPVILILVALIASFVPACRAARVDPLVALRHE